MSDRKAIQVAAVERVQAPQNMLEVVMRAAQDPTIDAARLREFLDIGRTLEADAAKKQYTQAWAQLQPSLPTIQKNGMIEYKPNTKGTQFAKWDDIHRACMPILTEHGFAVSFDSATADNKLAITVIISHVAGHEERRSFSVPAQDTGGSKSPAQAAASAFTLAQRHAFCKAFNILTVDQDDDGSGQGVPERITDEQVMRIEDIVAECDNREKGFRTRWAKWLKDQYHVENPAHLCQGAQLKAVMQKLSEKQAALGVK